MFLSFENNWIFHFLPRAWQYETNRSNQIGNVEHKFPVLQEILVKNIMCILCKQPKNYQDRKQQKVSGNETDTLISK